MNLINRKLVGKSAESFPSILVETKGPIYFVFSTSPFFPIENLTPIKAKLLAIYPIVLQQNDGQSYSARKSLWSYAWKHQVATQ